MKKVFQNIFKLFTRKSTAKILTPNDILARFVYSQGDIKADGSIRARKLRPKQGDCLSLFEITGMAHVDICSHGHQYADNPPKNRIHIGYGKFVTNEYIKIGLSPIYDNDPPRHVSIKFPELPEKALEASKVLEATMVDTGKSGKGKYFNKCA